jgi:pimeloyl-ACP methyl ester carboxylesterase
VAEGSLCYGPSVIAATVRQSRLEVNRVRSPVIEAGPEGSAEAIVFVHGNPGSRLDWFDLVGAAGRFARAVAFDMPGFGQADKPRDFLFTVSGFAGFIEGALVQLGIERVHLVVHDFGGPFGLAWAAAHPDSFVSVVLVNTPPISGYRWHLLAKMWRTPVLGELTHLIASRRLFAHALSRGQVRPLPQDAVDRMWLDFDGGTAFAVLKLYRASRIGRASRAQQLFSQLDRPALVVWGRRDRYIPVRFAEGHRRDFRSAEFVYLADSGHWPFLDDPDGAAAAILPFLKRQINVRHTLRS